MNAEIRTMPVSELPRGRIIGNVLTCMGCGYQIMLMHNNDRQLHRWWERLGWGKIGRGTRGKHGKGDLYCPECYPEAHRNAAPHD